MRRPLSILAFALAACAAAPVAPPKPAPAAAAVPARPPAPVAPIARKEAHPVAIHGETLPDDYFWLRRKGTPEVEAYLTAELAYAKAVMAPTVALQERLYAELKGRIRETDTSVPYREGGYLYYGRTEAGKQYPIFCRRNGTMEAPEEVVLDQNALAEGKTFLSVGGRVVSPDATKLAYLTDETGFRQYTLHVKDLATGKIGPEAVERVTSVAWAADSRTLFYVVEHPQTKRSYQLFRHVLGQAKDALVYEEPDERFELGVGVTTDKKYLVVGSGSHTTSELRVLSTATPAAALRVVAPREQDHQYDLDHRDGVFYVRTNSGGRNFRLVTAPAKDPARKNWKELVPHRPAVMLADVTVFRDFYVLAEREGGVPQLRIVPFGKAGLAGGHRIELPEPVHAISLRENREFDTKVLRFGYQSPITPESVFDYEVATRARKLLKQVEVPGFDPSRYVVELASARAADGVAVPYWTLRRKDVALDGKAAGLLYGYGSYGISMTPSFNSTVYSLVDRGVVYATAWIRGGGELGKPWHDAGRMANKRNTFTDFVAVAEALQATGAVAKDRLAMQGGSAGGLLMGAVVNLRPDLFRAVLAQVPFVDVLNTMLDESLPLTVGEFEEWGNPKKEAEYRVMRSYSPYDNVAAKAYPAMLVKSSYNDSQVMYWEPAKWVARLRATKTDANPLLFNINLDAAGHGGKSGRYDRLREVAFDQAFLLWQLGVEPVATPW
ncbi:MAG: S9 family peptidase [Anaeromyxobacteraceae bacterium]